VYVGLMHVFESDVLQIEVLSYTTTKPCYAIMLLFTVNYEGTIQ